jgi:predicted amidohydrolase
MDCRLGDPGANRKKIADVIREAAEASARLVVFPECAVTGYCFESLEEAAQFGETLDGLSAEVIVEACSQTGIYAAVGYLEAEGPRLYNAVMLVGPGGPIASYRKVHIPFIGVDRFVTRGDRPFEVFDLPFGKIGVNICYDVSFPEASRSLKLLGAQAILLPTNWPSAAWRNPEFVIQTRALENHVNFIAANRVGTERGWRFIGRSKAVDFNGDTVAEGPGDGEQLLIAEIDFQAADLNRIVNKPGLYEIDRIADRRPELYGAVTRSIAASHSAD